MTTHRILSRPFAALSAIAALATGLALTAAPSTARAETGQQIIMSDGNVDCPPCRFLKINDQNGLSFGDVAVEVQNGNQVVITAQVTMPATAGKPRTGSIVFTSVSNDASFMDYVDDACMASSMSRQATTQACDVVSRAFHEAAATALTAPAPLDAPSTPTQGIIMRDGGVCDPIRHMGC